jgi:hypothetical protein
MCFREKTNGLTSCFYLRLFALSCFELRPAFGKNLANFSSRLALVNVIGQVSLGYGLSRLVVEVAARFHPLMEYTDDLN